MESNEVKRFKAMIKGIIINYDKLVLIVFIIMFTVNGFITGFISNITQCEDKAKLYFGVSLLVTIGGVFFLLNEHDAEEIQELQRLQKEKEAERQH